METTQTRIYAIRIHGFDGILEPLDTDETGARTAAVNALYREQADEVEVFCIDPTVDNGEPFLLTTVYA